MALSCRINIILIIMIIRCSWVDGLIFGGRPDTCESPIIHWYSSWLILEGKIAIIIVVVCVLVDVVCVWRGYEGCVNGKCLIWAFVHNGDCQLLSLTIGRVLVGSACAPSQLNYVSLSLSCDIDRCVTLDPKAWRAWCGGWCSRISTVPDHKRRATAIAEVTYVLYSIVPGPNLDCVN